MTNDHLAKEADRLKSDPIFNKALDDMRSAALNALALANADDRTMILRLQQQVYVIDEIRTVLERFIIGARTIQDEASPYA